MVCFCESHPIGIPSEWVIRHQPWLAEIGLADIASLKRRLRDDGWRSPLAVNSRGNVSDCQLWTGGILASRGGFGPPPLPWSFSGTRIRERDVQPRRGRDSPARDWFARQRPRIVRGKRLPQVGVVPGGPWESAMVRNCREGLVVSRWKPQVI
jgi:hypothetical protein